MTDAQQAWPTLESQPAALTKFVRTIGAADDWAFADVLSVDVAMRDMIPASTRAFLVVVPLADWLDRDTVAARAADDDGVVFVKQRVANACGTIAVIHAAANNPDILDTARQSSLLASFLAPHGSVELAALAEQSDELKDAHQRAADESESDAAGSRGDLHFVCLTRRNDRLFLLDGRNDGPVALEACAAEQFVDKACDFIQQMMAGGDTIAFSVVALCLAGDVVDDEW